MLLAGVLLFIGFRGVSPVHDGIEYKDLFAIILTAVAVLLAAVTIFVAVVAIWGYNSIREESVKAAIKAAEVEAGKVATTVAQAAASREALTLFKLLDGAGNPGATNELAAALKSGGGKRTAAKPNSNPGKARRGRTGSLGGAGK